MKLVGDEKRIQALFREQKLEDLTVVPEFDQVWNEVQRSRSEAFAVPGRRLGTALIPAAFTLAVMSAMFLLSGSKERAPEIHQLAMVQTSMPIVVNNSESLPKRKVGRRSRKQLARRQVIRDAIALSTWKSPTSIFLETPARSETNSLPQLNQASQELQAFLPPRH